MLADIQTRYPIPKANILGHADVAPRRKADPSRYFPWKTLADHGFGLWCDPPFPERPVPFDDSVALQALGYDVSDVQAAIGAFKLHFLPDESARAMSDQDRALLHCLIQEKNR